MKFGGTSVGDGLRIRRVVKIIKDYVDLGNKVVVVVSALNGVTDTILEIAEQTASGNKDTVDDFVRTLARHHQNTAKEALFNREILERTSRKIEKLVAEFKRVLISISILNELSARSQDYLLSFGEKLSTTIVHAGLVDAGVNAVMFTGGEAGIVTGDHFGEAVPLMKVTSYRVREKLSSIVEKGITPVITGYIAANQDGITTTLGRGGSDYTATIIGHALDVDAIWIWTDVDGLMTADPQIEPSARTIKSISYTEGMELVYFGVKAMHPKALQPA